MDDNITSVATQDLSQMAAGISDRLVNAVTQIQAIADHLLGTAPSPDSSAEKGVAEYKGWYQEMRSIYDQQALTMGDLEREIDRLRSFI